MTTIAILRNTLKLNAAVITGLQNETYSLKRAAQEAKADNEVAISYELYASYRKERSKLAKAVALQNSVKAEVAAIFRIDRVQRKFLKVFGYLPSQQIATTIEQEQMLDSLIAEKWHLRVGNTVAA
jgi:hypothetical protein